MFFLQHTADLGQHWIEICSCFWSDISLSKIWSGGGILGWGPADYNGQEEDVQKKKAGREYFLDFQWGNNETVEYSKTVNIRSRKGECMISPSLKSRPPDSTENLRSLSWYVWVCTVFTEQKLELLRGIKYLLFVYCIHGYEVDSHVSNLTTALWGRHHY